MRFGISRRTVFLVFSTLWFCSLSYAFQNPTVDLKKVRIVSMDQRAVSLEGTLEIFNPNDLSSRFAGYTYQLEVEGQRLLTGTLDQPFSVPAQGTFPITIPATILLEDILALNKKTFLTGT
jgi:Late embryogenesis abundant protein.